MDPLIDFNDYFILKQDSCFKPALFRQALLKYPDQLISVLMKYVSDHNRDTLLVDDNRIGYALLCLGFVDKKECRDLLLHVKRDGDRIISQLSDIALSLSNNEKADEIYQKIKNCDKEALYYIYNITSGSQRGINYYEDVCCDLRHYILNNYPYIRNNTINVEYLKALDRENKLSDYLKQIGEYGLMDEYEALMEFAEQKRDDKDNMENIVLAMGSIYYRLRNINPGKGLFIGDREIETKEFAEKMSNYRDYLDEYINYAKDRGLPFDILIRCKGQLGYQIDAAALLSKKNFEKESYKRIMEATVYSMDTMMINKMIDYAITMNFNLLYLISYDINIVEKISESNINRIAILIDRNYALYRPKIFDLLLPYVYINQTKDLLDSVFKILKRFDIITNLRTLSNIFKIDSDLFDQYISSHIGTIDLVNIKEREYFFLKQLLSFMVVNNSPAVYEILPIILTDLNDKYREEILNTISACGNELALYITTKLSHVRNKYNAQRHGF
ncbi:MAG: hypothetical protein NZM04_00795 [Methylacidiphilales bacterium]|nr:hypothetical protein [Candidatus Methylacidiphilales bacterium]